MTRKFFITTVLLLFAVLAISACSGIIPNTGISRDDMVATQNAQIYDAAQATATQIAISTQIAQLQTQVAGVTTGEPQVVTATPEPVLPTATQEPATATAQPTSTNTPVPPTPTFVLPTWTPTATPIPCNDAQFVADVTVSDGSTFSPGTTFTKTWRLKNLGSCTWTTAYDLVFVSGDQMSAPSVVDFPGNVAPGQVIDLSVTMTAPNNEGSFRGNWKLRDASGVLFGVGRSNANFFVDIKVSAPKSLYPLDFAATMCQAEWTTGAGRLPCPTGDNDSRGFVFRTDRPVLESGYIDDEASLVMHPQMVTDGVIRGKYPVYKVQDGQHFQALVGCGRDHKSCDVNIQLDYQIGDGSIQTLARWHETYDEKFTSVDVDLSSLAGKDVKFILTVFANGASTQDRVTWTAPRIVNP